VAVRVDQYIIWLDVPVDNPLAVQMIDTDELIVGQNTFTEHKHRENTHKLRHIHSRFVNRNTVGLIKADQVKEITSRIE
jgi:hypothetical protein